MSDEKTSLAFAGSAKFSIEKKNDITTTSIRTVRGKPEISTLKRICFVHRKCIRFASHGFTF